MGTSKIMFISDYKRYTPDKYSGFKVLLRLIKSYELRFYRFGRMYGCTKSKFLRKLLYHVMEHYRRSYGLEINWKRCGAGLRLIHPFAITVNSHAVLGKNATLYKGVTIGEVIEGSHKGVPTIGDNVTIYPGATIVGNIHVGDRCVISPGAFVNFDVPDDSLVLGNPGVIHTRK